jgi:hypothetical protein
MCTRAVSALAHMLEERGLPTVVIALVLPQVVKTRPPRAVMTPFLLGRPFGDAADAPLQRRVLTQALQLLDRSDGPVVLAHFPGAPPGLLDAPDWRPAVDTFRPDVADNAAALAGAMQRELIAMMPSWRRFTARYGRTTTGLSGLPVDELAPMLVAFLAGQSPTLPLHDTPAVALRFLADDLKALYGEAVQADGSVPSARQIDAWFWHETVAGQFLVALRAAALDSADPVMQLVGSRFLLPRSFLPA